MLQILRQEQEYPNMEIKEVESGALYYVDVPSRECGQAKVICPACAETHSPGKQKNRDLSLT
jgi:hypothetical protein